MIKVKNLDKTYYKGKENEIHVINDTSLELPNTGLVFFLGQSGSGKTTLLNAIGGLDKADKGAIQYDNEELAKYNMSKVDKFRSTNIGYVFQNYLLLEDLSVYENLRIALDLIGINDKEEVEKRIEYVLKSVGLYKFRRKLAGQLSGGQQQRVSIARALIKKTKVIIADEPTGNLDSENTIEVMNILKKISKEALVLVVTHNEEIAQFYADRIVKLKDGTIESDIENESSGSLEAKSDKKIHLLDLKESNIEEGRLKVKLYSDDEDSLHDVTIIIKNNTIYIDSETRLQVVPGSNIQLIEDHYKKLELEAVDTFDYDISWYNDNARKNRFVESLKDLGRLFAGFYSASKRKFFNVVFILIGITIGILVLLQTNFTQYNFDSISTEPNVYYSFEESEWDPDTLINRAKSSVVKEAIEKGLIDGIADDSNGNGIKILVNYNAVNSTSIEVSGNHYPFEFVSNKALVCGKAPKAPNEVVIGKQVADKIIEKANNGLKYEDIIGLKSSDYIVVGISTADTNSVYKYNYKLGYFDIWDIDQSNSIQYYDASDYKELTAADFIEGGKITGDNQMIVPSSLASELALGSVYNGVKVVGIYNSFNSSIYTNAYSLLSYKYDENGLTSKKTFDPTKGNYPVYSLDTYNYTLVDGVEPSKDDEALASVYTPYKIGDKFNGFKIVGYYYPTEKEFYYTTSSSGITEESALNGLLTTKKAALLYTINGYNKYSYSSQEESYIYNYIYKISDDKLDEVVELFASKNLSIKNVYQYNREEVVTNSNKSRKVYPIIEAVLLAIILVYTYFSERAKMISEIHDIGVLRSLGAKRTKITARVIKELFVKATLTSLLGYIITLVVYFMLAKQINGIMEQKLLATNPTYMILGVVVLYATQLFIGVLPYLLLLRKTPSEINSKYDI